MSYFSEDEAHNYIQGTVVPALRAAGHTVIVPDVNKLRWLDYQIVVQEAGYEEALSMRLGDYGNRRSVQILQRGYWGSRRRSNFVFKDRAINVKSLLRTVAEQAQALRARCRSKAETDQREASEMAMHNRNLPLLHALAQDMNLTVKQDTEHEWPLNKATIDIEPGSAMTLSPSEERLDRLCLTINYSTFHIATIAARNFLLAFYAVTDAHAKKGD